MAKFTILGPNGISDAGWHLHRAGCRDLARYRGAELTVIEAGGVEEALEQWIDEELQEMGWSADDVRVLPCALEV